MTHLSPYYTQVGRPLQEAKTRDAALEKLAEEIVTLGDPQTIHYDVCHRTFPIRPRSPALQRRIEETRVRIQQTRDWNREQYMTRRTEAIVDETMADVHTRLGQRIYLNGREQRRSEAYRNCQLCQRIVRTQYAYVQGGTTRMEMGTELNDVDNQGWPPLTPTQVDRLEFVYVGPISQLNTGEFIATSRVAPIDELDLNEFHETHGEVENIGQYINAQIQCDRRVKGHHERSENIVFNEVHNGMRDRVNWEHRVTEMVASCVWMNNTTTASARAEWRFNTTTATTTTAGTTVGIQEPWFATDNGTYQMDIHRTQLLEGPITTQGYRMRTRSTSSLRADQVSVDLRKSLSILFVKIPKRTYKKLSPEQKLLVRAKNKSEMLMKQWMTADEYKALKNLGEVEVKSLTDPDVIFIIYINCIFSTILYTTSNVFNL